MATNNSINNPKLTLNGPFSVSSGTFTPTITGSVSNPTLVTYTRQMGSYTKMGNVVFVYIRVTLVGLTLGLASGNLQISGLPISATSTANQNMCVEALVSGLTFSGASPTGLIAPGGNLITLTQSSTSTLGNVLIGALGIASDIIINGFYFSA